MYIWRLEWLSEKLGKSSLQKAIIELDRIIKNNHLKMLEVDHKDPTDQ